LTLVDDAVGWNHCVVSPAGCGRASFHHDGERRVERWAWLLPLLFPVGLLGTVALITLSSTLGYLLAAAWGWLVFPWVTLYVSSHADNSNGNVRNEDTQYWRTRLM
jgi:hypothetical protein